MNDSVLDILIYLFENYMDAADHPPQPDRESLTEELERAGFDAQDVARALTWMDGLSTTRLAPGATTRTVRIDGLTRGLYGDSLHSLMNLRNAR